MLKASQVKHRRLYFDQDGAILGWGNATVGQSNARGIMLFLLLLLISPVGVQAAETKLVLLTWEDYIDPDIIAEFERQYMAKVHFVYYEDDDARDLIMAHSNATGFDLVLVDETMLASYRQQNWLYPFNANQLPNLKYVEHPVGHQPLAGEIFSVPYFWGTVGILYDPEQFPKPITRWLDYFQPPDNLKAKLLAINTAQTLYALALKALGFSINSTHETELNAATALLRWHRPYVKAYRNVVFSEHSQMVTGSLAAALAYNGDALILMKMNDRLRYIVPDEGGIFWYDSLAILASSTNKRLAMNFIDFINQPHVNARNAQFASFATANRAANQFLPAAFLQNPIIYPPEHVMQQLDVMEQLPPNVMKRIHSDFVSITRTP